MTDFVTGASGDAFIHVTFPSGTHFMVRPDQSGIVFDETGACVDDELAADMLFIKLHKLLRLEAQGSA
jgi:hypothetical protein